MIDLVTVVSKVRMLDRRRSGFTGGSAESELAFADQVTPLMDGGPTDIKGEEATRPIRPLTS